MHYIFKNKESYNKINNKYGTKLENLNRKIGKKFSILNPKRYFRYVKLFFNSKVLITIMLFAVIANLVINFSVFAFLFSHPFQSPQYQILL